MRKHLVVLIFILLTVFPGWALGFEFVRDVMREAYIPDFVEIDGTIYAIGISSNGSCDGYVSLLVFSKNGTLREWFYIPDIYVRADTWRWAGVSNWGRELLLIGPGCDPDWENYSYSWHVFVSGDEYRGLAHAGLLGRPVDLNGTVYTILYHRLLGSSIAIPGKTLPEEILAFPNVTLTSLSTDGRYLYASGHYWNGTVTWFKVAPSGALVSAVMVPDVSGNASVATVYAGEPLLLLALNNGTYVAMPESGGAIFIPGVELVDGEAVGNRTVLVGFKGSSGIVVYLEGDKAVVYQTEKPALLRISRNLVSGGSGGRFYLGTLDDTLEGSRRWEIDVINVSLNLPRFKPRRASHLGNIGGEISGRLKPAVGTVIVIGDTPEPEIYINGEFVGVGSVRLELPAGAYNLTIVDRKWPAFWYNGTLIVYPGQVRGVPIRLHLHGAWLRVVGTPENAYVYVDSQLVGRMGVKVPLGIGTHEVWVTGRGYEDFRTNITIEQSKNIVLNVTLRKLGVLELTSNVPGTMVYINGTLYGILYSTGMRLELPPGNYTIFATKLGYSNYTDRIELPPGETVSRRIVIEPSYGFINVTTDPPGAEIVLDGEVKGKSPALLKVAVGSHRLTLSKEGYESVEYNVTVWAGKTKTVSVELRKGRRVMSILAVAVLAAVGIILWQVRNRKA
ncbi:PEGA domain-containing protein [Thermococcus barossii]|uniref:PEGA domain-containing protein n=1 Tax=Thermococcus barossii TaxID=54077 RepID=A0A2Z2MF93_9EURY|nr:PEGA domain-containing protein [Thermococcus barossii]ASJ04586.1 hypothetical protein A3L01_04080 [Thermococcus barossii]